MAADLQECYRINPADLPGDAVIFGSTAAMREVHSKIERVVQSDLPVLLYGERGTGKDLIARFLHSRSVRKNGPFVKLSCAAIPRHLLESELLGCERGLSLEIKYAKPGLVEMAENGTLFLDEVGEMDLAVQRKLLRLLHESRYFRVGGSEERQANVRIVCSTNVDLALAARSGTFRSDLYCQLEVLCFRLSALRERKEDIPQLWDFFSNKLARKFGKSVPELTPTVRRVLENRDWPGNLCELESSIARVVILGGEEGIGGQPKREAAQGRGMDGQLEPNWRSGSSNSSTLTSDESKIAQILRDSHWSHRELAEELKRNYRPLLYRLRASSGLLRQRRRVRFPRPE